MPTSDRQEGGVVAAGETGYRFASDEVDAREYRLFRSLDTHNDGTILVADLLDSLTQVGLREDDARLQETIAGLAEHGLRDRLSAKQFFDVIRPNILLIERALQGNVPIPDFSHFCSEIDDIYTSTKTNDEGRAADYIPQLAKVDPDLYGVGLCTVDGQRYVAGDTKEDFCVQSCCKPIIYCLALEEHGAEHDTASSGANRAA